MILQKNRANYIFDDDSWQKMKNDEELKEVIEYIFEYVDKEGVPPKPFIVSKHFKRKEPSAKYFQEYQNLLYFIGCEVAPERYLYDLDAQKMVDKDNLLNLYNKYFKGCNYPAVKYRFNNEEQFSNYCFVKVENKERFLINQEIIRNIDTDSPESRIKRLEKQDDIHRRLAEKYRNLWFYCNQENERLKKDNQKLVELDEEWEKLNKEKEKLEKERANIEKAKNAKGIKGVLAELEREQKRNIRLKKKVDKLEVRVESLSKRLAKHDKRIAQGIREENVSC